MLRATRKTATAPAALALGGVMLLAGAARADLLSVRAELDPHALDGVTPLTNLPGYAGERVFNVWAEFSDPDDQCVAVLGQTFHVQTAGGTAFVNELTFGTDFPPSPGLLSAVPALNWDSYVTIGHVLQDATDALTPLPKFQGPNTNPWTMPSGWIVPPSTGGSGGFGLADLRAVMFGWGTPDPAGDLNGDGLVDVHDVEAALLGWGPGGAPTPQTLAGATPDHRVLLARVAVAPGENVTFQLDLVSGLDGAFRLTSHVFDTFDPACGLPTAGPCNMANGSPGCDEPECCAAVCAALPSCCDVEWDAACAGEAINLGCALLPGCQDGTEIPEVEACGAEINGGCNATPTRYTLATCGESYSGNASAEPGAIDQDWYQVELAAGGDLNAELKSEFPGIITIVDGVGEPGEACPGPVVVGVEGTSINCVPGVASATDLPPGLYCIIVQPAVKGGLPCGGKDTGYVMTPLPIPPVGPAGGGEECIPANRGACCLPSGNCNVMLPDDCASAGGNFMGLLSTCSIPPCQACCLPDDSCLYTADPDECTNAGGTLLGVTVAGGGAAVKACCFDDGRCCRRLTQVDCELEGGTFQAFNNCENCPEIEVCPSDLDDDGTVGVADLIIVITNWNAPYDVTDLVGVITSWGPCPPQPTCNG